MGYIYKITNIINNKVYIGKTSRTISQRWTEHRKNFYTLQDMMPIHQAMFKYGPEAFKIEEIEACDEDIINNRESYWIKYYDSYGKGYNCTLGGEGALKINYKEVLSLWNSGLNLQDICKIMETDRHSISKILKIYGITEQEIFRRGIGKKVLQFDLKGNFINKYDSLSDAANAIGKTNISSIRSCCNKTIKSSYNFLWKYEEDETPIEELIANFKKGGKGSPKKVLQYSLKGEYIQEFNSCREAAKAIGAPYHVGINSCCLGRQKTAYGFKWKYKE